MNQYSEYNKLVGSIYDSSVNESEWATFLETLARICKSSSAMLQIIINNSVTQFSSFALDDSFKNYHHKALVLESWVAVPRQLHSGEIVRRNTMMLQNQYHRMGGYLIREADCCVAIGLQRHQVIGNYNEADIQIVQALIPHFQRSLILRNQFVALKNQNSAILQTLDRLPIGIILVNNAGHPQFVNRQTDYLVQNEIGIKSVTGEIKTIDAEENVSLRKLIMEAISSDYNSDFCGTTKLSTLDVNHPLSVLVVKLQEKHNLRTLSEHPVAAVFIGTPNRRKDFSLRVITSLYGLTTAEARLTQAMANGLSISEIAQKFHLSKNTIRSQLRSACQKTGLKRQAELVQLVLTGPAALIM